ncbi:hypothetical protein HanRHA438_Chr09g0417631 [Helianthus annuus]|nr:hypothetical protein HanHA300_Chr09g0333071 [Helianthus annuus]KAJ0536037.1 hypothetical protein HanIR_Chr09g0437151 [Helianthus annuus]KAJ0543752.1 hypothetical protein HanHA89_Chr09g0354051 [Helianthus annuus]KAJ0708806.1 hypothetical protein HanLR1_Chr09g0333361 [Helianthus annuus]KAJ0712717.1 hypothetical protein HanOQP8_Chr09g0337851 [Helianthus annuus]
MNMSGLFPQFENLLCLYLKFWFEVNGIMFVLWLKSMLNDEPQLCPYCSQPFSGKRCSGCCGGEWRWQWWLRVVAGGGSGGEWRWQWWCRGNITE